MLYNIEQKKIKTALDCCSCSHFDKKTKKCNGINKVCFEYDEKTKTVIDGITKLPIKV
jgi:hypothetical protein